MPEVGLMNNTTITSSGPAPRTLETNDGNKSTVSPSPAEFSEIETSLSNMEVQRDRENDVDGEEDDQKITVVEDKVFDEIRDQMQRNFEKQASTASLMSSASSIDDDTLRTAENFQMVNHGFQPRASYGQHKKLTDIMGVTYNSRQKQFVILDAKGITVWKKDAIGAQVARAMNYPKYEYRLITYLVYAKKYNVYFGLGKDFSLKVLNRDFDEVCSVNANLRSVLFMVFNPVKDELITGGVGGTKVWRYHQVAEQSWNEIKPMANYKLGLKYELKNVGGSWVKRVDLDLHLQHLYCCSDMDLYAYDLEGNMLFKFIGAHSLSITGCAYSMAAKLLVTSSMDSEVKVWGIPGGHVHTFRGHSRAVTNLCLHPVTSALFLTSSLDGSVRMWSLDTMDCLYSIVVSSDGVVWMGITDDKLLYVSTVRTITLWSLNFIAHFWALARNTVSEISLVGAEEKTTRVVTLGEDSSVRLFARRSHKNLSTVLPPPPISPLQRVLDIAYSRKLNIVYVLINPHEVWLYTVRTDPACRIAVWDVHEVQEDYRVRSSSPSQPGGDNQANVKSKKFHASASQSTHNYRATENGQGFEGVADCCSLAILDSTVMVWTEEGFCSPLQDNYLLLGLEDGRILFMDPVVKGHKHLEFKACKDRIQRVFINKTYNCLVTLSQLKECASIKIWSLPALKLQYEVYCQSDVISFGRLETSLLTGHSSGAVNYHILYPAEDPGPLRPRTIVPTVDAIPTDTLKTEHRAPVIALDSCPKMEVFCSCSSDGAIKVWLDGKVLLTEIALDDPVSAAVFFNDRADLLIGFKNHLFMIDGHKVVPSMELAEPAEEFDKESEIYEDPAVAFEGVQEDPDPVDLENYLVPYNMEFSDDFLVGKTPLLVKEKEESEDEEEGSELSWAPTEIYFSPEDTPRDRSLIDLTLTPDVTKYDLQKQMKITQKLEGRQKRFRNQISLADVAQEIRETERVAHAGGVDLPKFGTSPGPTPSVTPASTPTVEMSEEELSIASEEEDEAKVEEKKEGDKAEEKEVKEKKKEAKKEKVEAEKPKEDTSESESIVSQRTLLSRADTVATPTGARSPYFQSISVSGTPTGDDADKETALRKPSVARSRLEAVDIRALMADAKKERARKESVRKVADHSHIKIPEKPAEPKGSTLPATMPKKPVKKKEATKSRKLPKRGQKPKVSPKSAEPPMPSVASTVSPVTGLSAPTMPSAAKTDEQRKRLTAGEEVTSSIMRPKEPISAQQPGESEGETELWSSEDEEIFQVTGEGGEADGEPRKSSGVRRRSAKSRPKQPIVFYDGPTFDAASVKGSVSELGGEVPGDAIREGGQEGVAAEDGLKVVTETQANIIPKSTTPAGAILLGIEPTLEMGHVLKKYGTLEDEEASPEFGHVTHVTTSAHRSMSKSADSHHRASSALTIDTDFTIEERDGGESDGESLFWETSVTAAQRPATGLTRYRPISGHDMLPRKPRPFTALVTNKEKDIYRIMEELFSKYKQAGTIYPITPITPWPSFSWSPTSSPVSLPRITWTSESPSLSSCQDSGYGWFKAPVTGVSIKPVAQEMTEISLDKLYRNDGVNFDENWQERMIERHMLMKMQKEYRAQSAAHRRHLLDMRQRQKRKQLLGHRDCDGESGYFTRSEASLSLTQVERANSVPAGYGGHHHLPSTPVPPPQPRPQTQQEIRLRSALAAHKEKKAELSSEMPFRLKPHSHRGVYQEVNLRTQKKAADYIDPKLFDPRNPYNVIRPVSSKSIPSKCSHYVLVTHPKTGGSKVVPTPLEEQLISERFPQFKNKWLGPEPPRNRHFPPHGWT